MQRSKDEIFAILNEITSYFSFARVLGYIVLKEENSAVKQLQHSMQPESKRLTTTERQLLVGLWLHNVNITKNWEVDKDFQYVDEIYSLLNELHQCYKPTYNTPINEQLIEIAFYEGDAGYDYQYVQFAYDKYHNSEYKKLLSENYNFDIDFLASTLEKLKNVLQKQARRRLEQKQIVKEYFSPLNLFVLKPNILKKHFLKEEVAIIKALSFNLGKDVACDITDIASRNTFLEKPIIALPDNRGYFIPHLYTVAIAMNETPYYWIANSEVFSSQHVGGIRGKMAEEVIYNILAKKIKPNAIRRDIVIRKTKSSNQLTDVDLFVRHGNIGVVFQVKSKRLTEQSKQGYKASIENDFEKAVIQAYKQGKKCLECITDYSNYYSLKRETELFQGITSFYNVCVVLDAYPTLSTLSYMHLCVNFGNNTPPLIPMTAFDLDIAIRFFSPDEFVGYLQFKVACAEKAIYGISEAYYLGAYVYNAIYGSIYTVENNKISREYVLFLDYIENIQRQKKRIIKCMEDIRNLLIEFPPPVIQ